MEKVTHIQIKYPNDNISDPIPIEAEAENVIYHPEPNVDIDLSSVITDINTHLANTAPTNHASTETTYGIGTSTKYGHVKISDSYTATNSADSGLVPSQKALYDGLATKAPIDHASNTTDFGVATYVQYGHVQMTDVIPQQDESQGIGEVPTPLAVRRAIVQAINEEKDRVETENVNKINIGTESTYNSHFINWETDDYVLNLSLSGDKESLSLNEKVNNDWEQLWQINMASLSEAIVTTTFSTTSNIAHISGTICQTGKVVEVCAQFNTASSLSGARSLIVNLPLQANSVMLTPVMIVQNTSDSIIPGYLQIVNEKTALFGGSSLAGNTQYWVHFTYIAK